MATQWFRVWHGMTNDPKFRTIARVSKQPISLVICTFLYFLDDASQNVERGVTHCDAESIATLFDVEIEQVDAVVDAFQGRLLDGSRVINWEKRQPLREDNSTERTRIYREKLKEGINASDSVTHCDATQRIVTLDKDKDKDTDKDIKKNIKKRKPEEIDFDPNLEAKFNEWWQLQANPVGKKRCRIKFHKICSAKDAPENLADKIIEGAVRYQPIWAKTNPDFLQHPSTWLEGEQWEDKPKVKKEFEW